MIFKSFRKGGVTNVCTAQQRHGGCSIGTARFDSARALAPVIGARARRIHRPPHSAVSSTAGGGHRRPVQFSDFWTATPHPHEITTSTTVIYQSSTSASVL